MLKIIMRAAVVVCLTSAVSTPVWADNFSTSEFSVSTPDLSNLVVTEGSGICAFDRCRSLDVTFVITSNLANGTLALGFAGGGAGFASGDPSDGIVNSVWDGAPTCAGGLAFGASCSVTLSYYTSAAPQADGDSAINAGGFSIFDPHSGGQGNSGTVEADMWYNITVVDPVSTVPEPATLGLLGLGLAGAGLARRKRRG